MTRVQQFKPVYSPLIQKRTPINQQPQHPIRFAGNDDDDDNKNPKNPFDDFLKTLINIIGGGDNPFGDFSKPAEPLPKPDINLVMSAIDKDMPEMKNVLAGAAYDAYMGYSEEIDLKHVMYRLLDDADKALSDNAILNKSPSSLTGEQIRLRQSLDAILPPKVRLGKKPHQLKSILNRTYQGLQNMVIPPNTTMRKPPMQAPPQKLSAEMSTLLTQFFQTNPLPEQRNLPEFVNFVRTKLSKTSGYSAESRTVSSHLQHLLQTANQQVHGKKRKFETAETPAQFKKLLDYHYNDGMGLMTQQQYDGINKLVQKLHSSGVGMMGMSNPDSAKIKERLNFILNEYPWTISEGKLDSQRTQKTLDEDHWGLEKPKSKIVQHIAVLEELEEKGLPPTRGKVLCLVGPPGVGKTSLAKSVARATDREMSHVALGGVHEEPEIRGHRSTYIGALPGRIAKAFVEAGTQNPIIVLDEIDKMSKGGLHGDPTAALLEVLDPKQNKEFKDHFVGDDIPLDLSKAIFIVTANYMEGIPEPLRDRMEIIELDAYDLDEKVQIGRGFLLPKLRNELGLKKEEFDVTDDALKAIITNYTYEAGVRKLDKVLTDLAEKTITNKRLGKPSNPLITPQDLVTMLDPPDTSVNILRPKLKAPTIGRVNGLAVSGNMAGMVGSFLATKDTIDLPKGGDAPLPGQLELEAPDNNLKEMTRDSRNHAYRWIHANREALGIDLPAGKKTIISLTTERGHQVDGDSAGAAMTTAAVSALTGRPIRSDVAMTGTITTHGDVLAIGGLKWKIRGAMNVQDNGVRVVFAPKENEGDLINMPKVMKDRIDTLDATQIDYNKNDMAKVIGDAANKATSQGKLLVVLTNRIEPILEFTLLPKETAQQTVSKPSDGFYGRFKQGHTTTAPTVATQQDTTAAGDGKPKFSGSQMAVVNPKRLNLVS